MPIPPRMALQAVLVAAFLASGCQQGEEVRQYRVPKPLTFPEPPPKVRLLAAILPHGERTWFLSDRSTGRGRSAERGIRWFHPFGPLYRQGGVAGSNGRCRRDGGSSPTVRIGRRRFTWGQRYDPVELTVVPLGGQAGSLLANVNRCAANIGLNRWPRAVWKK